MMRCTLLNGLKLSGLWNKAVSFLPFSLQNRCIDETLTHPWDEVNLTKWNFIASHDAATGYANRPLFDKWVKTQATDWRRQLDCGARFFDIRAGPMENGEILMHHGVITIKHKLRSAIEEDVLPWMAERPGEFAILHIAETSNAEVDEEVRKLFDELGIAFVKNCDSLAHMTVKTARTLSPVVPGLIAIAKQCVEQHFDPTVHCTTIPLPPLRPYYNCLGYNKEVPFNKMWKSLRNATSVYEPKLSYMQAHWQYNTASIAEGELLRSSVLLDTYRSKINHELTEKIGKDQLVPRPEKKEYKHLNGVEVNAVCDFGPELFEVLQKNIPQSAHVSSHEHHFLAQKDTKSGPHPAATSWKDTTSGSSGNNSSNGGSSNNNGRRDDFSMKIANYYANPDQQNGQEIQE